MPHIKLILCGGFYLLNATALIAQKAPDYKYVQKAVGQQQYQQKLWSMKQLPANSVFYKPSNGHIQNLGLNFYSDKMRASTISYPAFTNTSFNIYSANYSFTPAIPAPGLQFYLQSRRQQDYKWQKQSWWRDPSKGTGASLLKDFFLKDKSFIRL
jgi:hypothetical protein